MNEWRLFYFVVFFKRGRSHHFRLAILRVMEEGGLMIVSYYSTLNKLGCVVITDIFNFPEVVSFPLMNLYDFQFSSDIETIVNGFCGNVPS